MTPPRPLPRDPLRPAAGLILACVVGAVLWFAAFFAAGLLRDWLEAVTG